MDILQSTETPAIPRDGAGIVVRAGVPQVYGHLVKAAAHARIPVLFSANAFAVTDSVTKEFRGFRLAAAKALPPLMDAALDSSGFVAMARYLQYRWSPEEYLELVAARDWTWWAAMDYCVEPPVAGALVTKEVRLEATALGYHQCAHLAKQRGLKPPLPVIQGWMPADYLKCVELLGLRGADWPELVGIGSVCRRSLFGSDGVATIVEVLDRVLPAHVRFHLFGVKGGAVKRLGRHPRFASIDSQAYDYAVRSAQRTGRTQQQRAGAMLQWQERQACVAADPYSPVLGDAFWGSLDQPDMPEAVIHKAIAAWYTSFLLGEHSYREVAWHALQAAELAVKKFESFGAASLVQEPRAEDAEQAAYEALANAGYAPPLDGDDQ